MQKTPLTVRFAAKQTGAIILLIGIACIPAIGQVVAMVILIVTAFISPEWALKSLAASVVVTSLNPALTGESGTAVAVLKWLLLFVACGRSLISRVEASRTFELLMGSWFLMISYVLINSYFVSLFPAISVLKAVAFSVGVLSCIRLAALTAKRNAQVVLFVSELGIAVLVTSLPLMAVPRIGHFRNGASFQGILYHPQGLGIFLVMTGAATFATASKISRLGRILFFMGMAQWSLIWFTKCRTALVAIALCLIVYFVETLTRKGSTLGIKYIFSPSIIMVFMALIIVISLSLSTREAFDSYLRKGKSQSFDPENPELSLRESSRGKQVFDTLGLAEEHPVFGAGFGVDEDSGLSLEESGGGLFGIPLSAPIEQGFLPVASVAQLGLIGSICVLVFLLVVYICARYASGEISALFVATLGINSGEMVFYSFGGLGCLMWIILITFSFSMVDFRGATKACYK